MRTPLCICNGVIRSGSTWTFNVCRVLLQELAVRNRQPFGSTYLEYAQLDAFISGQWASVPGPTVIKAHQIGPAALAAVRTGAAKAVCSFRDPRDCVASDVVFMGLGLEASVRRVVGTLEYLRFYQSTDHILLVRYENMMSNRHREIRRIADHLLIDVDDATIDQVDKRTNIQATHTICKDLKTRPNSHVLHIASHRVDPETHLHENHICNARSGRWRDELTSDQGRWLTEFFSSWLICLGYETTESVRAIVNRVNTPQTAENLYSTSGFAVSR